MKYSQKSLIYKVLKNIQKNNLILPGQTVIVALSGGPDSVCLFDILFKLKNELKIDLLACHYNHRLRGQESYNDFIFVKKLVEDRHIKCFFGEAVRENMFASEEKARVARYAFFEKILKQQGIDRSQVLLATAHNANDQVETFLLRIIRGTGLKGLKCIPYQRENFIRPLLDFSRKEIEEYLRQENLQYRIDKTNLDSSIDRNFIRLKILPLMLKLNPNLVETTVNTVKVISSDSNLLDDLGLETYRKAKIEEKNRCIILDRKKVVTFPLALQNLVIRIAISKIDNLTDITYKQLAEVCEIINKGEGNKFKFLPHSLRITLLSDKIKIEKLK